MTNEKQDALRAWYEFVPSEKIFWFLGFPYKMELTSVREEDCWRVKAEFLPLNEVRK